MARATEGGAARCELILSGIRQLTPEVTYALCSVGLDGSLLGAVDGAAHIDLRHRDSDSLEDTVRQAIRKVEQAGFGVVRVESNAANVITQINRELRERAQPT